MTKALPKGWAESTLTECVSLHDKGRIPLNAKARENRKGPYPYYGANGQVDSIDDFIYEGEHVLLAEDGGFFEDPSRGVAYIVDGKFWVNNHAHILKGMCSIPNRFVLHQLNTVHWLPYVGGSTRLKLTQAGMAKVPFKAPPLYEQHRIVKKIDALMECSGAAKEALDVIPTLLDQYRQSVLASAFRGDLTKDWREQNPDVEPASKLLERIRTERRQHWEESELAKMRAKGKEPKKDKWKEKYKDALPPLEGHDYAVPDGWVISTPDSVCKQIVDCPHATAKYTDSGIPIVRTTEFRFGKLDLDKVKFVSEETYLKRIDRLKPTQGDVLYSREGGIFGIACEVPNVDLCMGQRMMMFRANPEAVLPKFLLWMLNAPQFFNQAAAKVTGSASPHVNVGDIKRFAISLPSIAEQQAIVQKIETTLEKIEIVRHAHKYAQNRCTSLNQSILAKAFRGELVPQDENDEPASVLLERIRQERAKADAAKPKRGRKKKAN